MKLPTGPQDDTAADEVAALIAKADGLVKARGEGGGNARVVDDLPAVVIDMAAELYADWLVVRPWRSTPQPVPDFDHAFAEGLIYDHGQHEGDRLIVASRWRNRIGDETGPWLALKLEADADNPRLDLVEVWRQWWDTALTEFRNGGCNFTVEAGNSRAAQVWQELTWDEALRMKGDVPIFPTPHHPDLETVGERARDCLGMSYLNAWRRCRGAAKPYQRQETLERVASKAQAVVTEAETTLAMSRHRLRQARHGRNAAQARLTALESSRTVGLARFFSVGPAEHDVQEARRRFVLTQAEVLAAKAELELSERDLKDAQQKRTDARNAVEAAAKAREEQKQLAALGNTA